MPEKVKIPQRSRCNEMELFASLSVHNTNKHYEIPSFNDACIVSKMTEFHKSLMCLEPVQFLHCSGKFSTLKVNKVGICTYS